MVKEQKDPNSILNYYKALIRLRKQDAQLRDGAFVMVNQNNDSVLSYIRRTPDGKAALVAMNFTADPQTLSIDLKEAGTSGAHVKTLLASFNAAQQLELAHVSLPPYGSYVGQVQP